MSDLLSSTTQQVTLPLTVAKRIATLLDDYALDYTGVPVEREACQILYDAIKATGVHDIFYHENSEEHEMTDDGMNKTHRTHLVEELIESLPCGSGCIYTAGGGWYVSTEWLVGVISARGFRGAELEDALAQMCRYFDQHVGHDSLVGRAVTKSGWPDLARVRAYCEQHQVAP